MRSSCSTPAPASGRSARRSLPTPPTEIDLLLTHLHLDHIEGLGFFAPLFDPECTVRDLGPAAGGRLARGSEITTYLSPPFFPLPFEQFPARISFTEVSEDSWEIDDLRIATVPVCHPGSTVGYRLSQNGNSLAYIPDNEPALDRGRAWPSRATPTSSSTTRSSRMPSTRRGSAGAIPRSATSSPTSPRPRRGAP